jgi:hypothetical protein
MAGSKLFTSLFGDAAEAIAARLAKQEVSASDPMLAVHNLTSKNLNVADRIGGLAAPSIAIAKPKYGFDSFGDISLIGDENLITPGPEMRVFSADAFTPRFPEMYGNGFPVRNKDGSIGQIPLTMDEAVRRMKEQPIRNGEKLTTAGAIRALVAPEFKTLDEIKANRHRIKNTRETNNAYITQGVNQNYNALSDELFPYRRQKRTDDWEHLLGMKDAMRDVTEKGIDALDAYYKGLPPEVKEKTLSYLNSLPDVPTEYFEAKALRGVPFSDFKAAIVPEGIDRDAMRILENNIPEIKVYDPNKSRSREEAFMGFPQYEFADGGRIAKAGAGKVIGEGLDAALRIAKEAPSYPVILNRADPATEVLRGRAAQMMLPKADRMKPTGPQFFDTSPQAYEETLTRVPQEDFMHMLPQPIYGRDLPKNNRLVPILESFDDVARVYADKMRPFVDKNVGYFYHTAPIYKKTEDLLQSDLAANEFMDRFSKSYAGSSPRTATEQNLLNASLLNFRDMEGFDLAYPVLNRAGNNDVGYPMITGMHPDLTRRLLAEEPTFLNNPKPTSFAENVRGNLQGITADTHNIRGILVSYDELNPGRIPREWFKNDTAYRMYRENGLTPAILKGGIDDSLGSQSVKGVSRQSEYGPIAEITERSANILGVPPAMGQSLGWFGLGNMTNLKSAPKTLTELLGDRVNVTSQYLGEDPDAVFKMFSQGQIPLMNQGGAVNADADIDAALMTARTEKAGGGGLSKLLTEGFEALVGKGEREALQALTPEGSGYVPVPGKPGVVNIPLVGKVEAKPIAAIEEAAANYMRKAGRPGEHVVESFPEIDKERAARIATAYDEMLHNPGDPAVRRSYEALIDETIAQYNALKDLDLDIRFNKPGFDPYKKSPSMGYADLAENRRLHVFPTEQGFGSDVNFDPDNNPLLKRVGPVGDLPDATANDLFRVVHDVYGHFGPGNPFFRAPGEEAAWLQHSRMYSPEALPAMSSETRGQNSWVNFGPYAKHNATASGADTIYADQKTGLLPSWAYEKAGGGAVDADIDAAMMIAARDHKAGGGGTMPYGALPDLPYDVPRALTPFSTPEMVSRSEALRGGDDMDAMLASSYSDDAISDMAAGYNLNKYIEDVHGGRPQPEATLSSHTPTLREQLIGMVPERDKVNIDRAYGAAELTGLPQFAEAHNQFIRTGESPSGYDQAMMVLDMAPGVVLAGAKPIYQGLKAGYQAAKPALTKVGLPTAVGALGLTAGSDEAEAGIFGEAATKLIGQEGLNLAKKMYDEGASMNEIEDATKWYAPPQTGYGYDAKGNEYKVPGIGAWRTYIDPKNAKFAERKVSNLMQPIRSVMEFPEFDVAYPGMMDALNVVPFAKTRGGYYEQPKLKIAVGDVNDDYYRPFGGDPYRNTLMHELQHAIQARSGFADGSSPDLAGHQYQKRASELGDYELGNEIYNSDLRQAYYFASPGEIEARNVANRFADPTLRALRIAATEDIPSSVRLQNYAFKSDLNDLIRVKDWYNSPEGKALLEGKPILNKDRP